jgi:hypothetical protein
MFLFVIHLMMAGLRAETCSEWYVIINTRWNVAAKEGLVILILLTVNVPYVHMLPEYRPQLDISLPPEGDPKFLAFCVLWDGRTTEVEGIWKEAVVAIPRERPEIYLEGLKKP